jgi:hypothetical protein
MNKAEDVLNLVQSRACNYEEKVKVIAAYGAESRAQGIEDAAEKIKAFVQRQREEGETDLRGILYSIPSIVKDLLSSAPPEQEEDEAHLLTPEENPIPESEEAGIREAYIKGYSKGAFYYDERGTPDEEILLDAQKSYALEASR